MGLFGKIRRKVNKSLRLKRKRTLDALTLASTCDITEADNSRSFIGEKNGHGASHHPPCTKYEALHEDDLSLPQVKKTHHRPFYFGKHASAPVLRPDAEDDVNNSINDENKMEDNFPVSEDDTEVTAKYVSSSSEDESESFSNPSLNNLDTLLGNMLSPCPSAEGDIILNPQCNYPPPPNSNGNNKNNNSSDESPEMGQMHIFHDDLSTLYEEPTDREDNDSVVSVSSMSDVEDILGGRNRRARHPSRRQRRKRRSKQDESIIRARWEYALHMMTRVSCGDASNCMNSAAEMALMDRSIDGEDMEMAEI